MQPQSQVAAMLGPHSDSSSSGGGGGGSSRHSPSPSASQSSSLGARSSADRERDRSRAASDDHSTLLDAHSAPAVLLPTEGAFSPPVVSGTAAVGLEAASPSFHPSAAPADTIASNDVAALAPLVPSASSHRVPVPSGASSAARPSPSHPSPSPCPSSSSPSSSSSSSFFTIPSDASFPIWTGSWNMGAKEMSVPVASTSATVSARAGVAAPSSVPSGAASPFNAWIPPGYKLYVVGLQESVSELTYRALDVFFAQKHMDCTRLLIPLQPSSGGSNSSNGSGGGANNGNTNGSGGSGSGGVESNTTGTVKVEGRGDGSFIYPKSTSIAAWVHRSARSLVAACAGGGLSLGITQGSKGGAAIAVRVLDSTLVFVSVHLSSTTVAARRGCYSALVESVGNALGESYFQLLEQFHHVVFLGDLNFRLAGIGAPEAVKFMQRGDVAGLLRHDELGAEMANKDASSADRCFVDFSEAPIDFWPTYKKHLERRAHAGPGFAPLGVQGAQAASSIYWVHEVYKTIYKEPSVHAAISRRCCCCCWLRLLQLRLSEPPRGTLAHRLSSAFVS